MIARTVHIDQALSNFALMFMQEDASFIANDVLPSIGSNKRSNLYFTFDRTNWIPSDALRAPTAESSRAKVPNPSTSPYFIQERALHDFVSYEEEMEADAPLAPRQDTAAFLMEKLMIGRDKFVADLVFVTASVANYTSLAAASAWSYTSTTTPLQDVDLACNTVLKNTGLRANNLTTNQEVYTTLKRHAQVLDLIKYVQRGVVTADLLAALFDVNKVNVGRSLISATGEGISSMSIGYIWGKHVLASYIPTSAASAKRLSFGYQFTLRGGDGVSGKPEVRIMDVPERKSTWVEAGMSYDARITSTLAGYIIFGATA